MILGIIDHKEFYTNGNEYKTNDGYSKIIEALASYFDKVILFVPVHKRKNLPPYEKLNIPNLKICPLPAYKSNLELFLKLPLIGLILIFNTKKCDILQVRNPSHIGVLGFFIVKLFNKPVFTYLAGDWPKVIKWRYKQGFKKYISIFYTIYAEVMIRFIVKKSLSFVTGEYLFNKYKQYKNIYVYISSSLTDEEIIQRKDTCQNEEKNILFVGRIEPEKGIKYLLSAINLLKNKDLNIKLAIIGEGSLMQELKKETEILGLSEKVNFLGYFIHNEHFLKIYDKADIFVLPSLGGEGTPKVILEAMARGIPVIATNDGGIPWLIKDKENGLIVKKASSKAITQSIEKIITESNLRKNLIKNAYQFVLELTLKKQTDKMIKKVFEYKNENRL